MTKEHMTYAKTGVNYKIMDPFKREATRLAQQTAVNLERHGATEVAMSRGESVYMIDIGDRFLAQVEEGLGTKNLDADAMAALNPDRSFYRWVAQDTVAMIVNDMITLGALPLSVAMHLAVGHSDWFKDALRRTGLLDGWKWACDLAQCAWGGGETPTLKGIVVPGTVLLSGSAIGQVYPKKHLIDPRKITAGDAILFFESSGIHANGLTMAREIIRGLPEGYLTKLPDGRTCGETLLAPTHIYVPLIAGCLARGVDIHYAINVTGHGWRKLMRATQPFTYVIERLPRQQPIFDLLQEHGPVDDREAYGNWNMGAGFALILPRGEIGKVRDVLEKINAPYQMLLAGSVMKSPEPKVVIIPKNLEFEAETLEVR